MPSFGEIVERSLALLQRRGRVSHTALRLEFGLDDATFAALREELVTVLAAADDADGVFVARDAAAATAEPAPAPRQISVLLCDIAETPPLEALDADARAVVGARFHAICGEVAGRLGGHVLPWVSDGVAIFFGHPRGQDDDALRAVRCGWEILRTLEAAREVVEREFGVRLEARLAIATGATGEGAEPFGDIPRSAGAVQERGATDRLTVDDATRTQAGATFGFETCGGDLFAVAGPADSDAVAPHVPPPLVGRTGERALLQALAERAAEGTRAAVLVRGEAGIGKTRLLDELAAGAGEALGMAVVRCGCSPYHRGSALYPLLAGLRRHWALDGSDASPRLAARTTGLSGGPRAVALLADLLGVAVPDGGGAAAGLGPARRRRESLAALADVLATEAGRAPLLLVIDDVHWADASTLELVASLLDGPRDVALMLALTARSEFAGLPQRTLQRIELGRLDVADTRRLVEHVAAAAGTLPADVVGEIAQHAAGSPLLAAELTRTALATRDDACHTGATLYGCLMARLDRDSAARDVAQLAATIGREFDRTLLDAVGTIEPAALDWGLERLVAEDVVVRVGPGRFAFCHSLLQDAARSSQRKRVLRSHNTAIATALLARFPHVAAAEPERIARHFEYAREMPDAVGQWQRAGREALARHALREATLHFERAIELNARTPDGPERRATELELRLLAGRAIAAHAGWQAPAAVAHHARAERLSAGLEPTSGRLDGLLRLAAYRALDARATDALRLALSLLPVADATGEDPALLPEAECEVGGLLVACGRHREALGHLARAVELCEGRGRGASNHRFDRDPAALALAHRALALACRDDHEGARYAITAATERLRDHPHPQTAAAVQCAAAAAAHVRGDHESTLGASAAALALATAEDLPERRAQALALHGWAHVRAGARDDGLGELRRAVADWSATGAHTGGPFLHGLLADALAHAGEPERALATLGEALRRVAGGERWYEPELHRMRAELLLKIGDVAGAQRSAGTAAALARRMRAGAWERSAAAMLARVGSASPVA
ncbi:MAG TPA: AAA family ATPase [Solirubrobacteraceae bacterium]|nr:AAA family ATPase [Solirubrobacteraceae bacterium]